MKGLIDKYKESCEGKKGILRRASDRKISRLNEILKEFEEEIEMAEEETFFETLTRTLQFFATLDEFPTDLGNLLCRQREVKLPSGKIRKIKVPRPHPLNIFVSHVDARVKDVFAIEKEHIKDMEWLFDIVTIKEDGLLAFKKYLECIPPIKEQMKVLKERKQFSTRYTFRPYPLATKLWLEDDASINVPSDLKSFLQGAIQYIFLNEWRTSIVLSAICVESVLADLYEEIHKTPAPDVPLGDIFRQIRGKIDFSPDIVRAIEMANDARISAVHRSRFPVSDREAINALYGATNFTLWYISKF
ncbi:MAG: hypothetical protein QXQ94_00075 [Candidatus Bathyarchaeia archaeon]